MFRSVHQPETKDLWRKPWGFQVERIARFLRRPWRDQITIARFRFKVLWNRFCPSAPFPVRLPYGGWWLAVNDVCSDEIFTGSFEKPEQCFVERFLKEGMTVVDIGAHRGFYTILASKKVGPSGNVIAFEPSPREQRRLLLHLKLNHCTNVKVEPLALARQDEGTPFFLVNGRETGCNSLRPPRVSEGTCQITVLAITLDSYLQQNQVSSVDFMKLDVEGAELEVLKGAVNLLSVYPRPAVMCEVQDIRTEPWNYRATEICNFLGVRGYYWFSITPKGQLCVCPTKERYDENLVAVPEERLKQIADHLR